MSLVPPLPVALLDAGRLFENFAALLAAEERSARMPTKALLVSGPSKTADIEQTLAYGIHGPRGPDRADSGLTRHPASCHSIVRNWRFDLHQGCVAYWP